MSRVTIFNVLGQYSARLSNSVVSLLNYRGDALKTYRIEDAEDIPVFEISFVSLYLYLGCYIDDAGGARDLPYLAGIGSILNGQRSCIHLCLIAGYQFAGTQHSTECWCGNSYGRYGVDINGCNMPCEGNAVETCGGPNRNSVYTTSESGFLITNAPTPAPSNIPTGIPTFDATLVWRVRVQLEGRDYLHLREVEVFDLHGVNRALNKPATQSSFDGAGAILAVDRNLITYSHTNNDLGKYLILAVYPQGFFSFI